MEVHLALLPRNRTWGFPWLYVLEIAWRVPLALQVLFNYLLIPWVIHSFKYLPSSFSLFTTCFLATALTQFNIFINRKNLPKAIWNFNDLWKTWDIPKLTHLGPVTSYYFHSFFFLLLPLIFPLAPLTPLICPPSTSLPDCSVPTPASQPPIVTRAFGFLPPLGDSQGPQEPQKQPPEAEKANWKQTGYFIYLVFGDTQMASWCLFGPSPQIYSTAYVRLHIRSKKMLGNFNLLIE